MKKIVNIEERRDELAVKVLHDLAVNPRKLTATSGDGTRPIVVALDEELLSVVMGRVRQRGECANLFVELAGGDVVLFRATVGAIAESKAEVFSEGPVHQNTTIGMMAEYVLTAPEGVQMSVKLPKLEADVEYVERRELVNS